MPSSNAGYRAGFRAKKGMLWGGHGHGWRSGGGLLPMLTYQRALRRLARRPDPMFATVREAMDYAKLHPY